MSIEIPGHAWLSPGALIFLERKMLDVLIKDVLKSPGKVLALCLIVYLAATSFFVSLFLVGLGVRWLHKKAKALEATEREAAREAADKAREQAQPEVQKGAPVVAPAAASVQTAPTRQYAKSAVVIPLKKTGTD
ncbi:hypothetical protein [Paraburkholderia sp. JHI869]|uniref:hypothetical protein n=1 Tax=Paraburkholderia sp. JHI869 TaxID=3112959 RepID=UPI003179F09F